MGKYHPIGAGGEASVFGQFKVHEIISMKLFNSNLKLDNNDTYIIKVFNDDRITQDDAQSYQKFCNLIRSELLYNTLILPITYSFVNGAKLLQLFELSDMSNEKNYKIELQPYGGKDFFYILFESPTRMRLSSDNFLKIWYCMCNILEDLYNIIFRNKFVITDIKMENMVLTDDFRLRLIDIQMTPLNINNRIYTPALITLPTQYFNPYWWTNYLSRRDKDIQYYKQTASSMVANRKLLYSAISFIYDNNPIEQWVNKFSTDKITQKDIFRYQWYFILYPILMAVFYIIYSKSVKISDKPVIIRITQFCLLHLRSRGRDSSTESGFKNFITHMRDIASPK